MALRNPPSWLQNGSHPAQNDRLTTQALYNTTGIIGSSSLLVTGTSGLGLSVASGWAAILANAASTYGVYVIYNDAANALTIPAYAVTNPRIDRIVATVNDSAIPYGSGDSVSFSIIAGTEAVSPTAPATPNNSISLATVLVPVGSGAITITDTRTFVTSNSFLPLGGGTVSGATTFSAGITTSAATTELLGAGTDSVPPLKLTAGSNLTTAANAQSGAIEFDGKAFYGVPAATSGRASIASLHYYALGSQVAHTSATTIQSLFGTAMPNGLTVQSGILYEFEVVAGIVMGNATSKTITLTIGAPASGAATYFEYAHNLSYTSVAALTTLAGPAQGMSITSAITTNALTAVATSIIWKGQFRVNAGGFFLPQITYNTAAPGTTNLQAGSYIKVTPIRSIADGTTTVSVGAWS